MKKMGFKRAKSNKRPGRSSKSNAELWARRIREYRLWSMGVSYTEIAAQFNINIKGIYNDIAAIVALEPIEKIKEKIDANLKEVIRTCFEKVNEEGIAEGAKVGYIHEVNEATARLAKIHGLEKPDNIFNLNQTLIQAGSDGRYAKWDNDRLQEEFARRRLRTGTGNGATGA